MASNTHIRNLLSELVPTPTGEYDGNNKIVLVENKSITVPTSEAVSLYDLIAPHQNTERVVLQLDGNIRARTDGRDPTASFGAVFGKYDSPDISVNMLKSMRAIAAGESDVHIFVMELTY